MCFSAQASFVTAAATGAMGVVALGRTTGRREWPMAAMPLIFALQQTLEGSLWLTLPATPGGPGDSCLTFSFLWFAEVFWPVYVPLAVLLIETSAWRRWAMRACLAIGASVSLWLFGWLLNHAHGAAIEQGHIVYVTEARHSDALGVAYLAATALPLMLSSSRALAALGVIVLAGSFAAYALYWDAYVSVFCYFAAGASVVLVGHFEMSRRRHRLAQA